MSDTGQRETSESRPSKVQIVPSYQILLCLDPACHGEFYLPLIPDDHAVCPNDREHPVAVYTGPTVLRGDRPA